MNSRTIVTIGGCLLIAATLAGCGGGMGSSAAPASPTPTPAPTPTAPPVSATVTINIVGMSDDRNPSYVMGADGAGAFSPNPATVAVGQVVVWHNSDTITHTATADGGAFDTGNIAPGATSAPITVTAAGNLAYHCQIHPSMVGTVIVTP